MRRNSKLVIRIATLLTACGLSIASAQTYRVWPQPKNPPPKGPPQLLPWPGGHGPKMTVCRRECGYPTGL